MNHDVSSRWRMVVLLLAALVLAGGCGKSDRPRTVRVSGKVTLDEVPLQGAVVRFVPADPKAANSGSGTTDADGKYSLYQAANAGVAPGHYKVIIEYYARPDGSPIGGAEGIDIMQLKMQGQVEQKLPEKYSDFAKTELKIEVSDDRSNEHNFPLKST